MLMTDTTQSLPQVCVEVVCSAGAAVTATENENCLYLLNADSVIMFKSATVMEPESTDSRVSSDSGSSSTMGFAGYDNEYQQCLGFIRLGLAASANQQRPAVSSSTAAPASGAELFRPPKGLLLHGPAGTGKSRLMRSLVRAAGCRSVEVSHSILLSG